MSKETVLWDELAELQRETYSLIAPWYEDWQASRDEVQLAKWLSGLLQPGDSEPQGRDKRPLICDLGCGTGSLLREFSLLGWDGIGIDHALGMLNQARRPEESAGQLLYLEQDLRFFELFGTVNAMLCLMDTVNHLLTETDLHHFFSLVHNYLHPGGSFIFDAATEHHLSASLGQQQFYTIDDEHALFWASSYDAAQCLSQADITLFTRRADELWEREDGLISERYYNRQLLEESLQSAGFKTISWLGEMGADPAAGSERIYCLCRR